MDRRERLNDGEEALRTALDANRANTWTALPGIVQSFDPDKMTCVVQPAIKMSQTAPDLTVTPVNLPLCLDCPVIFPRGGGVTLTFPIKEGDECLLHFASRCIDAWWQQGGVQPQAEFRMHDLSDGFALVGVSSQPNVISDISTTTAQLRSDDGSTFVELDPDGQIVTITAPGGVTINADVTVNGSVTATDEVTGNGVALSTHTHGGVTTGSGHTGEPD